jgi:transmembrane sensor
VNAPGDAQLRAIHAAAEWYARLRGEPASPALEQAWQDWLAADAAHRQAWQRVEAVCGEFKRVPGQLALPALSHPSRRRAVLRSLALFTVLGGSGLLAYRQAPWAEWRSDYRTATGERRSIELADGSQLTLNTRSAVDVRFSAEQRLIELHAGEILISTHHDPQTPARPFVVHTEHGRILALGTRFNVRIDAGQTTVSVLEKAVEAGPQLRPELAQRVVAGQQLSFSAYDSAPQQALDIGAASWASGHLIVVERPLSEVLAELARYRSGYLGCDPAVAQLKISGAFPLDDSEQALAALTESFPLRVERFTPLWTRLVPREH